MPVTPLPPPLSHDALPERWWIIDEHAQGHEAGEEDEQGPSDVDLDDPDEVDDDDYGEDDDS